MLTILCANTESMTLIKRESQPKRKFEEQDV